MRHAHQTKQKLFSVTFVLHSALLLGLSLEVQGYSSDAWRLVAPPRWYTVYVNSPYKTMRCQQFATITLAARSHSPQSRSPPDLITRHNHACHQISLTTIMLAAGSHLRVEEVDLSDEANDAATDGLEKDCVTHTWRLATDLGSTLFKCS